MSGFLFLGLLLAPVVAAQTAGEQKPPNVYIDKGACPFECCTYREWVAHTDVTLLESPNGKKVVGWDFVPVPNRPRSQTLPAKQRELKRQQKEDEEALNANEVKDAQRRDERKRIDTMWLEAGPSQRQTWLEAMSEQSRIFAPKPGARPSQVFLTALQAVVEPALPGFS